MQHIDEKILERLELEITKTYYTFKRFMSPSTFALLYHDGKLKLEELNGYLRNSDKFIPIDDKHIFINFIFTEQYGATKAAENLILNLDQHFENNNSYIAIDKFDAEKTPAAVLDRLQKTLKELKTGSHARVEDDIIITGIL